MQESSTPIRFSEIGERLRAFRMGRGLAPEDLAGRLGISRAALYRAEKGQIPKIETLIRISDVLGVSLPTLLGVGIEYVDTAIAFFERMRQLEETSHQIVGLFGPISYLLTSDTYDATPARGADRGHHRDRVGARAGPERGGDADGRARGTQGGLSAQAPA